jgi:hypothetical protein
MAGTIVADTLTHSTAGSIATNYVVNGSAKAWVNYKGTTTNEVRDSLNVASVSDDAVGVFTMNYSNSLNNSSYAATGSIDGSGVVSGAVLEIRSYGTGSLGLRSMHANLSNTDMPTIGADIHGDLA